MGVEIEVNANSAKVEVEVEAELGNISYESHFDPLQKTISFYFPWFTV